ncbi:response regulator [Candidatus Falkowbacteria bacterium]|nr:response regulator [Candidatus Falkowbacteria bacterium]OIP81029.1 MAG: hypothetical protein AUK20_00880 [Parcubacteria group bacterium CG2_30_45_37]
MAKKILLIEDDVNLLYGLQAKFSVEGFSVATDAGSEKEEILEKIRALKPDYVILDIILPRVDGFEVLKEIKTDPQFTGLPVYIFTNLSDDDSRERAAKLGADLYLLKIDFNLDEFVEKFKKIISNAEKINV